MNEDDDFLKTQIYTEQKRKEEAKQATEKWFPRLLPTLMLTGCAGCCTCLVALFDAGWLIWGVTMAFDVPTNCTKISQSSGLWCVILGSSIQVILQKVANKKKDTTIEVQ